MSPSSRKLIFFSSLIVFSLSLVRAQTAQSGLVSAIPGGSAANYYYAKPGDLTILVNVWGEVERPGRYEVSTTIDLIHLLSLAGGPSSDAKLGEIKITRIVNGNSFPARKSQAVDLEDLTKLIESDLALYPGDIIFIERSSWAKIRDAFSFVVPVATLAVAILNFVYVFNR